MYFLTRRANSKCLYINLNLGILPRKYTENSAVTCQGPDGAHPVSHLEAGPAEDGGDEGPTQNGRGSSDLGVSVIDVAQDV